MAQSRFMLLVILSVIVTRRGSPTPHCKESEWIKGHTYLTVPQSDANAERLYNSAISTCWSCCVYRQWCHYANTTSIDFGLEKLRGEFLHEETDAEANSVPGKWSYGLEVKTKSMMISGCMRVRKVDPMMLHSFNGNTPSVWLENPLFKSCFRIAIRNYKEGNLTLNLWWNSWITNLFIW
jgi:hypothetical protein